MFYITRLGNKYAVCHPEHGFISGPLPKNQAIIECHNLNNYEPLMKLQGGREVTENHKVFLALAGEAFKPKSQRDQEVAGYHYDDALSTDRTAVYQDGRNLAIASRSTVKTDPRDLESDAEILAGTFIKTSSRLKRARQTIEAN